MRLELTNLLPIDRSRSLKQEYFVRLATVALSGIIVVIVGSGALLIPSYLYLHQEIDVHETSLEKLNTQLSSSQEKQANVRLSALMQNTNYLSRLATTSSATPALKAVIELPHAGIRLTGFTYTPAGKSADGKMTLIGTATTRETLRAYVDSLGKLPFVTAADLPISAYAKESNIPFSITLVGTLRP
jgi:hypothetical protein